MINNTRYEILVKVFNEFDSDGNTIQSSGKTYTLDTYDYEMITFDMSINEIQDISQRNSTYSKTITLPDTNHNRVVFGYISNLNVDSDLYNPNKRADCTIFVDTIPVYSGTLQLKKVKYGFKTGENKLECIFFSSVLDFYKNIGEKYLTGLTGLGRYNHSYTPENVTYSWTQSQSHGYYYPLIDYGRTYDSSFKEIASGFDRNNISGTGSVTLYQFYPAVYAKTIVDEIFRDAGFQYDSYFFNTNYFKNMVIPFSNKNLLPDYVIDNIKFGETGNVYSKAGFSGLIVPSELYTLDTNSSTYDTFTVSGIGYGSAAGTYSASVKAGYIENTYSYNQYYRPSIYLNFFDSALFVSTWVGTIYWATKKIGDTMSNIVAAKQLKDITNLSWGYGGGTVSSNGYIDSINWDFRTTLTNGFYKLEPGEKSFIFFTGIYPTGYYPIGSLILDNLSSDVKPVSLTIALANSLINIPSNLPSNIKQKDFLTSIYKMFNLYVEPDKLNPKILRIETRDDYYNYDKETGWVVIKDWTDKIDLDQNIEMDILSDTQDKTFRYTYKEAKDYFNTQYKSITNRIQGDAIEEIDSDFATGDKKIDIIFEPSVLCNIPGFLNFPVVNTSKQISETLGYPVGSSDMGIRVLQRSYSDVYSHPGCVDLSSGDTFRFNGVEYTYYPYVGTYNDPYGPTVDISFDQQLFHFWYQSNIVNNNLFNDYHKNQFLELSDVDGRILTCEMYLTPKDIYDFYFNHIIYLEIGGNGSYWRVNNIKNYDITGRSTCTVEFIKALYPSVSLRQAPIVTTTTTTTTTTIFATYSINWNFTESDLGVGSFVIRVNGVTAADSGTSGTIEVDNNDTIFIELTSQSTTRNVDATIYNVIPTYYLQNTDYLFVINTYTFSPISDTSLYLYSSEFD